jgi:hypothetical protein
LKLYEERQTINSSVESITRADIEAESEGIEEGKQ